jgi:protein involved in polysaccharide export with SLBB domain
MKNTLIILGIITLIIIGYFGLNKYQNKNDIHINFNQESKLESELQNGDRIYIRQQPNYQKKSYVIIEGEVKYPGEYAIEVGKTTLSEILRKSGGPTELADLNNSYLYRIGNIDEIYPEFDQLRRFPALDLSSAEYRYVRQMYAEKEI